MSTLTPVSPCMCVSAWTLISASWLVEWSHTQQCSENELCSHCRCSVMWLWKRARPSVSNPHTWHLRESLMFWGICLFTLVRSDRYCYTFSCSYNKYKGTTDGRLALLSIKVSTQTRTGETASLGELKYVLGMQSSFGSPAIWTMINICQ